MSTISVFDFHSSDGEGCPVQYHSYKSFEQQEASSEDEFEKEMASEVMSAMKMMISPAAASLTVKAKRKKPVDAKPNASSRQQSTGTSQGG